MTEHPDNFEPHNASGRNLQLEMYSSIKVIESKIDTQTKNFDEIKESLKLKATTAQFNLLKEVQDKHSEKIEKIESTLSENKGERLATRSIIMAGIAIFGSVLAAVVAYFKGSVGF
jgi:pyrroloquinoline quinone (PQQ) biosynthesis protein C